MKPELVVVDDFMQSGYRYERVAPMGKDFHADFKPDLTPAEMLELGIFGGRYMTDSTGEFPDDWFIHAKFSRSRDENLNYFGIQASQSLAEWRRKGWIYADDPRGWFQWYCRYFSGRRLPDEDLRQIKRWKAMTRHVGQIRANCMVGDELCRPRQRQALLQWAYDSRKL